MSTSTPEKRLPAPVEQSLYRADEVLWLVACGEEPHRAARRVGVTLGAIEATLTRHHRKDDWAFIVARLPRSLHDQQDRHLRGIGR